MPHLEVIRHQAPTVWGRVKDSLRSLTLGPFSLKDPALTRYFGGAPTSAGVSVTEYTALNYAAVWQAVSLIAGDIGSLPKHLYKRDKNGGKERYTDHPLYYLLHDAPNAEMTSMVCWETLQAHAMMWGNGYAEIERDGAGRPIAVWPLLPHQVTPFRDERMQLKYRVAGTDNRDIIFEPRDILHIPGLGYDGITGYGVIRMARESLGLLAASERFGATFFGNGSTFGGALSHPKVLGEKASKSLRDSILSIHQGPDKAHRFLILEEGMSYQKLGVDPNDAQFLETRKFQITEVCRWFNLSPSKLRELDNSSVRANIEQDAIDYVVNTLRPWVVRWEQELNRKLISPRERYIQQVGFNLDGLLRGDLASRYAAYAVGRQWGWLSPDDVRDKEDMNPLPGGAGKIYLVPTNMAPADRINDIIDAQVKPAPAPVVAPKEPDAEPKAQADPEAERALVEQMAAQAVTIGELRARSEMAQAAIEQARATAEADVLAAEARYQAAVAERAEAEAAHAATVAELAAQMEALTGTTRADMDAAAALAQQAVAAQAEADARALAAEQARQQALDDLTIAQAAQTQAQAQADEARAQMAAYEAAAAELIAAAEAAASAAKAQAEERALVAEAALRVEMEARDAADEALSNAERDHASAVAQALAEATDAKRGAAELLTTLITANRDVMVKTLGRLVRREADRARSKQATPEKLRAWAGSFYEEHESEIWCEELRPVVAVHLTILGSARSADDVTQSLVRAHMETSRQQILAVADTDPAEYQSALRRTLDRWETQRAVAVADAFVQEEIAYVRSIS